MKANSILNIVLALVIVTLPFSIRLNGLIIIMLSVYSIYSWIKHKTTFSIKLIGATLFFSLVLLGSLIDLINHMFDVKYIETSLSALFLPIIFFINKDRIEFKILFKYLVYTISTINLSLLIYALFRALTNNEIVYGVWSSISTSEFYSNNDYILNWPFLTYTRLIEPLNIHPAYYGLIVNITLIISIYLLSIKKINKTLFIFTSIINAIFIVLLSSKANILALISMAFILVLINLKKYNLRTRAIIIVSILLLFISIISIPSTQFRIQKSYNTLIENISQEQLDSSFGKLENGAYRKGIDGSTMERMILWRSALRISRDRPMLGLGNVGGNIKIRKISGIDKNTHNQYLQILLNGGIISLLILVAYLILPLYISSFSNEFIISIITIFLINLFFENILDRQWGIVIASFFYSLLIFYPSNDKSKI